MIRSRLELEARIRLAPDVGAREIGRQQVREELARVGRKHRHLRGLHHERGPADGTANRVDRLGDFRVDFGEAAVKELARKEGRLATFMARPFNEAGGSGFHLHVSADRDDDMLMTGKRHDFTAGYDVGFDGEGRIVLLGFRPQHRGQSWATFPFIFNALEKR